MRGFLILCDFAEEVNGKLYIMGGGWSRITPKRPTLDISLAAKVFVPWVDTNRPHDLRVTLYTEDGNPVRLGDEPAPVELGGQVEVGRPPGLASGTEIDLPLVFRFEDLPLSRGRYRWDLKIDNEHVADVTFDVLSA